MLTLHSSLSLSTLEENMILIEGGTMEMQGVNIQLDDFELCRYPVSQRLWLDIFGGYPERTKFKNPHKPIERVSWEDLQNKFLPALRRNTSNSNWCFPTEAQWEYAARGGKYAKTCIYSGSDQLKETGWYVDNSLSETNPIACKRPNSLGLYDMSGNVDEWCQDFYGENYYQQLKDQYGDQLPPNPSGPEDGDYKVVRGGAWDYDLLYARVSFRFGNDPLILSSFLGFRLCRYSAREGLTL